MNPPLPPFDPNAPESPLESLVGQPMHLKSEEEVRAFMMKMKELRDSSQARQAYFRGKVEKPEKPTAFDEL